MRGAESRSSEYPKNPARSSTLTYLRRGANIASDRQCVDSQHLGDNPGSPFSVQQNRRGDAMTKNEQILLTNWRFKVLQQAGCAPNHLRQSPKYR